MKGIELKEFRTLNSKHFLQEDKTIKVYLYNENVHYLENNEYKEIDNSLEETLNGFKNKANNFKVEFDVKNKNNFINISNKEHNLTMYLKDEHNLNTDYKVNKSLRKNIEHIDFKKVIDNIDFNYEIHSNKLKESIVINKKNNIEEITFIIKTKLKLSLNKDNTISMFDGKKEIYRITKPYMIDANDEISENVFYKLKKLTNKYELSIKFEKKWLNSKNRKYPVIIDPTIDDKTQISNLINTYIYNGDSSTTTYNQNRLIVGVNGSTIYRTLLKFNLPSIPASYKLVNATLDLYAFPVASGTNENAPKIGIHRINTNWTEETAKWNNMNDKYYPDLEDYFGASRNIGDNTFEENYANITAAVKDWYNNPNDNYGIMLKQVKEEDISNFTPINFASRSYNLEDARPALIIAYKNYNGITSYYSYSTQEHFFGTSNVANYTGNLTVTFDVANTVGGILPANLSLVYNTYDVILNHNYGYGLGIKPNLMQLVEETGLTNFPISYTSDTGTVYYFYYDETESVYKDEDGLGLKLKLVDNNYHLTDKNGNVSKFVNKNNKYYLVQLKDTNGSTINIEYDSNNRISKVTDSSNNSINITYDTNKINFISPYKTTEVNLTNNLITSITSLFSTETITYTTNNLIEKIKNPNGLSLKYEYTSDFESKVSKVSELSMDNNEGNYLTFKYNVSDTKVVDRLGIINTYIFNDNGNVVGTTNLDETQNLTNAYGKTYTFGEDLNDANKLLTDKSLVKYVDNLINDSSFENRTDTFTVSNGITKSFTTDARTGKYALQFNISNSSATITNSYPLENTKDTATFSFYAKGNGKLSLTATSSGNTKNYDINLTDVYQRFQITVDNTTNNNVLQIKFNNFECTTFIIDDMQLEYGSVANYYNLVNNSSFIYGTNDWDIDLSGDDVSATVVDVGLNKKALKIHSNPNGDIFVNKIFDISGDVGDTYNLSFWYKNNGIDATGYFGLNEGITWATVFFYYNDDFIDGTCVPATYFNVGNDNWQFFSANFSAKAIYNKLELRICSFANANDCWLTNFTLFKDIEEYSFDYDDNGNLISAVDLDKGKSTMKYNKNNQLLDAMTPMGANYSFEYDKKVIDRVINSTSPTGINNQIVYDDKNNPIKTVISNRKTNSNLENNIPYYIRAIGTNKYLYVNNDKSFKVKACDCSIDKFNLILSDNNVKIQNTILNNYYIKIKDNNIILEYGDNNNLFNIQKNDNNSYTIKYGNNAIGVNNSNNIVLTTYEENNLNQQFIFEQANYKESIINNAEYTPDGRFIKSVTDSLDNTTNYDINTINGLTNSVTNPNNITTNYTYDEKLRITKINKANQKVEYQYSNDNLSNIIYGTDNYNFTYNEYNRTSNIKINNNTLVTNTYQEHNGNLSKVTYGNNTSIEYNYDDLDRLNKINKENDQYQFHYDNLGRLSKTTSLNNNYLYEYDFAKRLSKYNHNGYTSEYDYNKDNNITTKSELLNNYKYVYNYTYNIESLITNIKINNNNFNFLYDELGRIKENNINDSYKIKYKYLTNGYKTSNIINEVNDNNTIYKYTYDKLGNITEIYNDNNLINKYYYDDQSELIQDDNLINNITTKYTYDNYGNILSKKQYTYGTDTIIKEDIYSYENPNWQDLLTKFNNETITYDEIGNPLTIGDKTFTWMNGRELKSYSKGNLNINYTYNLNGIRTSKNINGTITKYYLDGLNIVFEDRAGSMIYYIYNQDQIVGFIYNGITYYYHKNILGDIIGILNTNYQEIVKYTYDAYGNILSIVDNSNINLGEINPFRYRSYYYDTETQLYYLNSRYYNPTTGRFINADNIVCSNDDFISNNLFTYVSNNPIMDIDITGHVANELVIGGAASSTGLALPVGIGIGLLLVLGVVADIIDKPKSSYRGTNQKEEERKQTIYALREGPLGTDRVVYIGRTVNFNRRKKEHQRNPERRHLYATELKTVPESVAPFVEQYYIELHHTLNSGVLGCNKRNEIGMSGPRREKYNNMFMHTEISLDNLDTLTYVGGNGCK